MPPDLHVIDADGHVLEPIDIWDKYIDAVEGRLRTRTSARADNAQQIRTEIYSERLMTLRSAMMRDAACAAAEGDTWWPSSHAKVSECLAGESLECFLVRFGRRLFNRRVEGFESWQSSVKERAEADLKSSGRHYPSGATFPVARGLRFSPRDATICKPGVCKTP